MSSILLPNLYEQGISAYLEFNSAFDDDVAEFLDMCQYYGFYFDDNSSIIIDGCPHTWADLKNSL